MLAIGTRGGGSRRNDDDGRKSQITRHVVPGDFSNHKA